MKMKISAARDIIDVDWDTLIENHGRLSRQAQWMWQQLTRTSLQKAIHKFRAQRNKDELTRCSDEELKNEIMRPFGLPEEYIDSFKEFVIAGLIPIGTKATKPSEERIAKRTRAQERSRNRDKLYSRWEDIRPQLPMPDQYLECDGLAVNIDTVTGEVIVRVDPMRPIDCLKKALPLIEDYKEKSKRLFPQNASNSGSTKSKYAFVVDLLIRELLTEEPNATDERILCETQLRFSKLSREKEWGAKLSDKEVEKVLPPTVVEKFKKNVSRLKKEFAS